MINIIGGIIAAVGVVAYREMIYPYNILMWFPITIGYSLWFTAFNN